MTTPPDVFTYLVSCGINPVGAAAVESLTLEAAQRHESANLSHALALQALQRAEDTNRRAQAYWWLILTLLLATSVRDLLVGGGAP